MIATVFKVHGDRNGANSRLSLHDTVEVFVLTAVEGCSWCETFWHGEGEESISFCSVYAESLEFSIAVEQAESVSVYEGSHSSNVERRLSPMPYLLHFPHVFTDCLWCEQRCHVMVAAMQEICCIATVEASSKVRGEGVNNRAPRTSGERLLTGAFSLLAIVARDDFV